MHSIRQACPGISIGEPGNCTPCGPRGHVVYQSLLKPMSKSRILALKYNSTLALNQQKEQCLQS